MTEKRNSYSITTRGGDGGTTRLFSGEEVYKDSLRPETYGDIDELGSILGIARFHSRKEETKNAILYIQRCLFLVSSELATSPAALDQLPQRLDQRFLDKLDSLRDALEEQVELPGGFTIPGECLATAHLDHARTVARRCERKAVGMMREGLISNKTLIKWLNRLSDYIYLLARHEEEKATLVNSILLEV